MSQFTPENNVLVGTIPDVKPVILPTDNPFTTRVMQFEKMRISAPEELGVTIDFWIQLTEVARLVFKESDIQVPVLQAQAPFFKDNDLIAYLPNVLSIFIAELRKKTLTAEVNHVIDRLAKLSDDVVISYAQSLLDYESAESSEVDKEFHMFLWLCLKVIYVKSATLAALPQFEQDQSFHDCPMCGDSPIASVIDPMDNGLRYLLCNLCETKWHKVRSTCHDCSNTGRIELLSIEGQESAMKAESCPECHAYIKHLDRTKNPMLDVYVEDLSTLSLDFTLAEENQQRLSFNLYLR